MKKTDIIIIYIDINNIILTCVKCLCSKEFGKADTSNFIDSKFQILFTLHTENVSAIFKVVKSCMEHTLDCKQTYIFILKTHIYFKKIAHKNSNVKKGEILGSSIS